MKKNLLTGSFTYGAVTIFSRFAAIILIPILTRFLSPDEYGALNIVITTVQLVTLIVTLEISQAVTFYFNNRNETDREQYPATALWFSLSLYLIFILIIIVTGGFISDLFSEIHIGKKMIKSGALLLAANGTFFFLQNQLRLEFKSKQYAILSVGYVVLTCLGAILGAIFFEQPPTGVILGQAIGASIINIGGFFLMWYRFRIGVNRSKLRQMLRYSLPLVPAGLLLIGGQQAPKFLLGFYGSLEDVGIYGLASQIAGFAGLAILGVQTAITPSVLANHHLEETPRELGKLFEDFTIVALFFCCFLTVYSPELVLIFSTGSYSAAAGYVPLLAFSIALNGLYIFFPGKIIRGKSALQLYASAGGFIVSILAGVILIKLYGIKGAAVSSLLSAATFITIWYYLSQKLYLLPIRWLLIFKSVLLAVAVCLGATFLLPSGFNWYVILLKAVVLGLLVFLIAKDKLITLWKKYFRSSPPSRI